MKLQKQIADLALNRRSILFALVAAPVAPAALESPHIHDQQLRPS
jgi:hypothetical protein